MKAIYLISLLMSALALSACEEQGPAEQLGEDVDEAANAAQESAEEAADQANDAFGN